MIPPPPAPAVRCRPRRGRAWLAVAWLAIALPTLAEAPRPDPSRHDRLGFGIGDRVTWHVDGEAIDVVADARRVGLDPDYLEVWLPRGWQDSWLGSDDLRGLTERGVTPIVAHWYFGDTISRERIVADRHGWHRSLARMARRLAIDAPVLVLLEPEFNNAPPPGETAVTAWPGFADEIREAARIVRHFAPEAQVGLCAGNFGLRDLEPSIGPVADELDFLAFQEMRGSTRHDRSDLDLGTSALGFARYLKSAFDRPVLLAYVAVSSYGGWTDAQRRAVESLTARREALVASGVFGLVWFQLRDDPEHRGWFGAAERSFGALSAKGQPKPVLEALRGLQAGSSPPSAPGPSPTPR